MNPGGIVGEGIKVEIMSTRVEGGRMVATVRLPDGTTDEIVGNNVPAGWTVGFRVKGDEHAFDITNMADRARLVADDMASRPGRLPFVSVGQTFDSSQYVGQPPIVVVGLSHLHDWREHCNACPTCGLHDGFHDEERHAARVTIPAHCLLPFGVDKRPARIERTEEEIAAVRRARAAQREES
jgi:hypothetical protein